MSARRNAPTAPSDRAACAYLESLKTGPSHRTMRQALKRALASLAPDETVETFLWSSLRYAQVERVRAALIKAEASPAAGNLVLSALRGVAREAFALGLMPGDEHQRIAGIKGVRGSRAPRGRALGRRELHRLFAACADDPTPSGRRDAAVLAVLFGAGLRRAELVALDYRDYSDDTESLRVRGKGNKDRTAFVADARALDAWLEVRGMDDGPLFWPIGKGGRLLPRRMTTDAVYLLLRRRGEQAGVPAFSPHDLRRTFVSDLLDEGVDLATVQRAAGHASPTTTARYDRRDERALHKAVGKLDVPYVDPRVR